MCPIHIKKTNYTNNKSATTIATTNKSAHTITTKLTTRCKRSTSTMPSSTP